jgi:hypothetical protein
MRTLRSCRAHLAGARLHPLTLESKSAIKHSLFSVKDPERLVLDLETDELARR